MKGRGVGMGPFVPLDAFSLSPGITPTLTDVFVVELPILLGILYVVAGRRGVEAGFALNAIVLGAIKLFTDFADPWDDAVAIAGIVGGLVVLVPALSAARRSPRGSNGLRAVGMVVLFLGALKIALDFFDPFDVLLADVCVITGLWLIAWPFLPEPAPRPAAPS